MNAPHRLQLKLGTRSSSSSFQREGSCSRISLLSVLVGVILLCATIRSVTTIQKFNSSTAALLEFAVHDDVAEDEDDGIILHNSSPQRQDQQQRSVAQQNSTEFGPVIHIIQTRFMQFQPNLTELGLARVLLFETFCLPTLLRQSSNQFYWILRTDPMLHDSVRQALLDLVRPYSNIYVVASNGNPEGFRSSEYMADIQPNTVWNGDYHMLVRAHQAAQTRLVVESRLDADDGLYTDFVADLEQQAIQYLTYNTTDWKLWCSHVYVDWQLVSPWKDLDPASGILLSIQSPMCVTPGLSVGYSVKAKRRDYPGGAHHILHHKIPSCDPTQGLVQNCLSRFPESKLSAVRARTITSAGMGNVVLQSSERASTAQEMQARQHSQDELWSQLNELFGITKEQTTPTRRTLMEKQTTLASENLKGQCIKGFTCKGTSRDMLKQVASKGKGGETPSSKKKQQPKANKKQKDNAKKQGQMMKKKESKQ